MNKNNLERRHNQRSFVRVLHKEVRLFVFIAILGFSAVALVNFAKTVKLSISIRTILFFALSVRCYEPDIQS